MRVLDYQRIKMWTATIMHSSYVECPHMIALGTRSVKHAFRSLQRNVFVYCIYILILFAIARNEDRVYDTEQQTVYTQTDTLVIGNGIQSDLYIMFMFSQQLRHILCVYKTPYHIVIKYNNNQLGYSSMHRIY